jgi:rRNA maturation RNase YbeY
LHDTNPKTQLLGEIFINWDDCVLNINKYQHLSLLFTHGLLHLLQFNHNTPKNEKQMNILQNKIITLLK